MTSLATIAGRLRRVATWTIESARQRGIWKTATIAVSVVEDAFFDWRFGTETSQVVNSGPDAQPGTRPRVSEESVDTRLATYGTLSPGQRNHHMLTGMSGEWRQGTVRGWLAAAGWAAPLGFPALVVDPDGPLVQVHLFESLDLPNHWVRLDDFEGEHYRRVVTQVSTPDGTLDAWIYVLAGGNSS